MYLKQKLMKAASVCLYVFTALWFVAAAWCFALSNYIYWMCVAFAIISLYDGFVITSVREKMTSVKLSKNEEIKYLVCWILSIVALPAFILNAIAFFRKREDELVIIRQESSEAAEETTCSQTGVKSKKPFYRTKSFITACVALILIVVCSFSGMCFETSGFSVKVADFTLTQEMTKYYNDGMINGKEYIMPNDTSYSVTVYVPKAILAEDDEAEGYTGAPTVFVLPGFTRTKATMSQYCMELSRRGAVVFCMDPGGQGGTTETSTTGANGIEYLVQYVYNNTDDFYFCDRNRFGAVGHSAGGGNVCTLAADMAGSSYEESVIKSVYISGYIKTSSANKYKNLNCNAALSYAYYDEGAFRYQSDTTSFEVISLRFINEVAGLSNNYKTVTMDYGYGDMTNGTYRIVHRENINHCFEMYDSTSIANTIEFFDSTLNMNSGIGKNSQIWFGKEFSNGLALAAAFTFVLALCGVLMQTPFFATLKKKKPVEQGEEDSATSKEFSTVQAEGVAATAEPVSQTVSRGTLLNKGNTKSVAHKITFWTTMILTAIIACLDYIPLANLSIEIFPTSNLASVFTFVFPARMINAILLWAAINGTIGLILFFGITLCENAYEWLKYKRDGVKPQYDWSKFEGIKIHGEKWYGVIFNVLKAILLALIMFGAFYLLVQLSYWTFHQDFRFMLISAAPINARMFVTALEYMPIIFIFYISNSIRVNMSIGKEGWKEWQVISVGALANSLGLAFILLINYVCFFTTGTPFYGYWGNANEVWLFVNMVFAIVVMMFILPIFNRLFYKMTGNVWTGAIACCMIFVMMTISASVSYIPMY
ncbi:MAG: hypothetical protein ACI4MQ_00180 [Candidatus Coproplasma sp.]